jgi:hypothetical protein
MLRRLYPGLERVRLPTAVLSLVPADNNGPHSLSPIHISYRTHQLI